jgi:phosphoribosylaminoimidazole-succinocarboxamide synthase
MPETVVDGPSSQVVMETHLDLPLFARGKVRDIYDLGDQLLIVATDRLSAFDVVLPTGIPDKGRVLTGLSAFWFGRLGGMVPTHFRTADIEAFPASLHKHRTLLGGRSMIVRKLQRIDIECVVRGYLAGSAWKEYAATGCVGGIPLPAGLRMGSRLPEPVFTPARKADAGHDENITEREMAEAVGDALTRRLRDVSLAIYRDAAAHVERCGLVLVDTKFEFGLEGGEDGGDVVLIDEVLTPDSSRFWDAAAHAATGSTESYDKQVVRDYLERVGWDKRPPAPPLPPDVVAATRARYLEAYRRLTGAALQPSGETDVAGGQARTVRIVVTLKPGVLDAPGQAIRQGLDALGHPGVCTVRAGKYFELEITDEGHLAERVREMCEVFLANTLIEEYRFDIV